MVNDAAKKHTGKTASLTCCTAKFVKAETWYLRVSCLPILLSAVVLAHTSSPRRCRQSSVIHCFVDKPRHARYTLTALITNSITMVTNKRLHDWLIPKNTVKHVECTAYSQQKATNMADDPSPTSPKMCRNINLMLNFITSSKMTGGTVEWDLGGKKARQNSMTMRYAAGAANNMALKRMTRCTSRVAFRTFWAPDGTPAEIPLNAMVNDAPVAAAMPMFGAMR
mmetsp:Transcript_14349/g.41407  ORF Transcript_14349/g.41407 Transcript_14349/m.41407 type:complete len:224 (-) Transcript_14349:253-924(-)